MATLNQARRAVLELLTLVPPHQTQLVTTIADYLDAQVPLTVGELGHTGGKQWSGRISRETATGIRHYLQLTQFPALTGSRPPAVVIDDAVNPQAHGRITPERISALDEALRQPVGRVREWSLDSRNTPAGPQDTRGLAEILADIRDAERRMHADQHRAAKTLVETLLPKSTLCAKCKGCLCTCGA